MLDRHKFSLIDARFVGPTRTVPTQRTVQHRASTCSFLSDKLVPPGLPATHVSRARLMERLDRGIRFSLVIVTGVAGAGKSTLGAAWIRAGTLPGPCAWFSIDEEDNRPGVFWSYVLEALRGLGLSVPGLTPPADGNRVERSFLVSVVKMLREAAHPVVLVLDGFEAIDDREIGMTLDFVLQHAAPALHLVILGRDARAFPLHRHKLAGDVIEIGNDELAFSPEETKSLLDRHGVRLARQDYDAVQSYTGGWVGALRLLAVGDRTAVDPARRWPGSVPHAIADLLIVEVLDSQPPLVQELLLRASIDKYLHPDLADRLTGRFDSETLLRDLARSNVFVEPVESRPGWYRCQTLFRQALHAALDARRPGLAPQLHARAAAWYAERGCLTDSLRHSSAIGDWEFGSRQLVGSMRLSSVIAGQDAEVLRTLLSGMPSHAGGAPGAVTSAALALTQFDMEHAAVEAGRARAMLDTVALDERVSVELCLNLVEAMLGRYHGQPAEAERAAASAEHLWLQQSPERARAGLDLRLMLLANLGAAQGWAHERDAARQTLQEVIATCGREDILVPLHDAAGELALLEVADAELHQAEVHAHLALEAAQRAGAGSPLHTGAAEAALAAAALERNALSDAADHLARALAASDIDLDPVTLLTTTLVRARLALGRGDGQRALDIVDGEVRAFSHRAGHLAATAAFAGARLLAYLALADCEAAAGCLADIPEGPERTLLEARIALRLNDRAETHRLLSRADAGMPVYTGVSWFLLRAELAARVGAEDDAVTCVRQALARARPSELRRAFVEAGPWLRRLIRLHPEIVGEHQWLVAVPGETAAGQAVHRQRPPLILEALTEREMEVLKLLAQAMSVRDIGAELYLSVNTVKTHLKSIYRKLAATGRSDAARRAREMQLIP